MFGALVVGDGLTEVGFHTSTHPEWVKWEGPTTARFSKDGRQSMAVVKRGDCKMEDNAWFCVTQPGVCLASCPAATEVDQFGQWC